ncbi:hypothetical protein MNV49_004677 [Pseudohyphozyma bogoriensis]|nr:hypothetical protein MNV49_004677 [Pseudohyphozyma bogoriensis]
MYTLLGSDSKQRAAPNASSAGSARNESRLARLSLIISLAAATGVFYLIHAQHATTSTTLTSPFSLSAAPTSGAAYEHELHALLDSHELGLAQPAFAQPPPLSPLNSHLPALSPLVVAPRTSPPLYAAPGGCNSSEFLRAISQGRIRPDGASLHINRTLPDVPLNIKETFKYSFDIEGCKAPHVFDTAEACDLIQAFGGVFLKGDSFMRHLVNALFILVSNRTDGAVEDAAKRAECRGDSMFDDCCEKCRHHSTYDSQTLKVPVCNNDAFIYYEIGAWGAAPEHLSFDGFTTWLRNRAPHKKLRSPVFIISSGLHHNLSPLFALLGLLKPYLALSQPLFPRPISIWSLLHSPGNRKPEQYAKSQGADASIGYNRIISRMIKIFSPGEAVEGAMQSVDWFNVTEGADSYDGTHYAYQVSMEKVQVLLNYLDLVWTETKAARGMLDYNIWGPEADAAALANEIFPVNMQEPHQKRCAAASTSTSTSSSNVTTPTAPELTFLYTAYVICNPNIYTNALQGPAGIRKAIPIVGGNFTGPLISGNILNNGADWGTTDPQTGLFTADTRYTLQTAQGDFIYTRTEGPTRTTKNGLSLRIKLETGSPSLYWLNNVIAFGYLTDAATINGNQSVLRIDAWHLASDWSNTTFIGN